MLTSANFSRWLSQNKSPRGVDLGSDFLHMPDTAAPESRTLSGLTSEAVSIMVRSRADAPSCLLVVLEDKGEATKCMVELFVTILLPP